MIQDFGITSGGLAEISGYYSLTTRLLCLINYLHLLLRGVCLDAVHHHPPPTLCVPDQVPAFALDAGSQLEKIEATL